MNIKYQLLMTKCSKFAKSYQTFLQVFTRADNFGLVIFSYKVRV